MKLLFQSKKKLASDIYSFTFHTLQPISWVAGQSIRLELDTLYETQERRFTISSAPYEKHITITTQVSGSDFKQALSALQPGDEIDGYGVDGDFVWQDSPSIFIAGGIGITPYISMLNQLKHEKSMLQNVTLFHSVKMGDIAFENQLKNLQHALEHLTIELVRGQRIDARIVSQKVPDFKDRIIYISGSSKMIEQLSEDFIKGYQCSQKNIKKDWFVGLD